MATSKKPSPKKAATKPKKKAAASGDIPITYEVLAAPSLRVADEVTEETQEESPEEQTEAPPRRLPGRAAATRIEPHLPAAETDTTKPDTPAPEPISETTVITQTGEVNQQPEPLPEEHKPKAGDVIKSLWARITGWKYLKWVAIGLGIFLVFYLVDTIRLIKLKHDLKETKKVEAKVDADKAKLKVSEDNLEYLQRRKVDSAINEKLKDAASLMQEHMRADERTAEENVRLKRQVYDMQEKIRTASVDTLIELGRRDANR